MSDLDITRYFALGLEELRYRCRDGGSCCGDCPRCSVEVLDFVIIAVVVVVVVVKVVAVFVAIVGVLEVEILLAHQLSVSLSLCPQQSKTNLSEA